ASAQATIASSGTATIRRSDASKRSSPMLRTAAPAKRAAAAALEPGECVMTCATRPPAEAHERRNARPARPGPASLTADSVTAGPGGVYCSGGLCRRRWAASSASRRTALGLLSLALSWVECQHDDPPGPPQPGDPEGDHPGPRGHGTPRVVPDALQVPPI